MLNPHVPMVFPWFSHGFPMVFLWFSYGFPMVSLASPRFPVKSLDLPGLWVLAPRTWDQLGTSGGKQIGSSNYIYIKKMYNIYIYIHVYCVTYNIYIYIIHIIHIIHYVYIYTYVDDMYMCIYICIHIASPFCFLRKVCRVSISLDDVVYLKSQRRTM